MHPPVPLPDGRHFAVTWSIADHVAGLTSAMLRRSRAFVRLGGVSVDILSVDARPDYPELEQRLRERGELIDGMRLVNVWDWLRTYRPPEGEEPVSEWSGFQPLDSDSDCTSRYRHGVELSRTRFADDGRTAQQTDHYRLDGSLMLTERRSRRRLRLPGSGIVHLCDVRGRPARSWGGLWAFYHFWLDELRRSDPSWFIVDSKAAANFMLSYRRRSAIVSHVVHSSHLAGSERPFAPLRKSRRMVFENLRDFDSVVILTRRQRDDVVALLGAQRNLAVIPNSTELGPPPSLMRSRGRGVVIASLTAGKRVDHAAKAALAAARECDGITLDIYGDGPRRAAIQRLVQKWDGESVVRFHGYRADARTRLREASFLVLTSQWEGFSLAILESLAAGCIPIAYDVPYGPGDLIRHGENGFLVESGDQGGLLAVMLALQQLSDEKVEIIRQNARETAKRYSDDAVTALWAAELRVAAHRRRFPPLVAGRARVALQSVRTVAGHD